MSDNRDIPDPGPEAEEGEFLDINANTKLDNGNSQSALPDVKLSFSQFYGKPSDSEIYEGDFLSSLQFNPTGDLLAVGDKGGRITLYKRQPQKVFRNVNYKSYLTFQSHEPEFDYLKSVEIEEKVSQVNWVPRGARAQFLLASNDKAIKLWRISEQSFGTFENLNVTKMNMNSITSLSLPRIIRPPPQATATLRKEYTNGHFYHINTVTVNSDQDTFLSSDDLRINLWNLEVTDQAFVIVDIKPESMDYLQEVITTSTIHPSKCNIFAYSTSKGTTKLCDMRANALCDQHSKLFQDPANNDVPRGLFTEVVESIIGAKFSNSGRFLATRDYMKVKIWDIQMESRPVATFPVHDFLDKHCLSLYENDSIFDRFNVSWNGSDSRLVSGSYHNMFSVFERASSKSALFEAPKDPSQLSKTALKPKSVVSSMNFPRHERSGKDMEEVSIGQLDFNKKSLYTEWHPRENILAVACNSDLYLFHDRRLFN